MFRAFYSISFLTERRHRQPIPSMQRLHSYRADKVGSLLRPKKLPKARSSLSYPSQTYIIADSSLIKQPGKGNSARRFQTARTRHRVHCSGQHSHRIFYSGSFKTLVAMKPEPSVSIPDASRIDYPITTGKAKNGCQDACRCDLYRAPSNRYGVLSWISGHCFRVAGLEGKCMSVGRLCRHQVTSTCSSDVAWHSRKIPATRATKP